MKRFINLCLTVLVLFTAVSCDNFFNLNNSTGSVSITLPFGNARNLYSKSDVNSYTVSVTTKDKAVVDTQTATPSNPTVTFELWPNDYTIQVFGYATDDLMAYGYTNQKVIAGQTATATIKMSILPYTFGKTLESTKFTKILYGNPENGFNIYNSSNNNYWKINKSENTNSLLFNIRYSDITDSAYADFNYSDADMVGISQFYVAFICGNETLMLFTDYCTQLFKTEDKLKGLIDDDNEEFAIDYSCIFYDYNLLNNDMPEVYRRLFIKYNKAGKIPHLADLSNSELIDLGVSKISFAIGLPGITDEELAILRMRGEEIGYTIFSLYTTAGYDLALPTQEQLASGVYNFDDFCCICNELNCKTLAPAKIKTTAGERIVYLSSTNPENYSVTFYNKLPVACNSQIYISDGHSAGETFLLSSEDLVHMSNSFESNYDHYNNYIIDGSNKWYFCGWSVNSDPSVYDDDGLVTSFDQDKIDEILYNGNTIPLEYATRANNINLYPIWTKDSSDFFTITFHYHFSNDTYTNNYLKNVETTSITLPLVIDLLGYEEPKYDSAIGWTKYAPDDPDATDECELREINSTPATLNITDTENKDLYPFYPAKIYFYYNGMEASKDIRFGKTYYLNDFPFNKIFPKITGVEIEGWSENPEIGNTVSSVTFSNQRPSSSIKLFAIEKSKGGSGGNPGGSDPGAPEPTVIEIHDENELQQIKNAPDGYYKLMNDITVTHFSNYLAETFTGVLDGNGYTINFVMDEVDKPLFKIIEGGKIENLKVDGTYAINDGDVKSVFCRTIKNNSCFFGCSFIGTDKSTASLECIFGDVDDVCDDVVIMGCLYYQNKLNYSVNPYRSSYADPKYCCCSNGSESDLDWYNNIITDYNKEHPDNMCNYKFVEVDGVVTVQKTN